MRLERPGARAGRGAAQRLGRDAPRPRPLARLEAVDQRGERRGPRGADRREGRALAPSLRSASSRSWLAWSTPGCPPLSPSSARNRARTARGNDPWLRPPRSTSTRPRRASTRTSSARAVSHAGMRWKTCDATRGVEAARRERQRRGVGLRQRERRPTAGLLHEHGHHRSRQVDPRHGHARPVQAQRDPAGADADLEARAAAGQLGGEQRGHLRRRGRRQPTGGVVVRRRPVEAA